MRRRTPKPEVRPSAGVLTRVGGQEIPLRFVSTEDPLTFLAVTVDGERVGIEPGDRMTVDVLGPGQSVKVGLE